jgi:hypothetical protein
MKTQIYILFILLLFSIKSYSQDYDFSNYSTKSNSITNNQTYLPLLYSPKLDMRTGEETITSIHKGVSYFEDKLIGTKWFSEKNILGKTGGVAGRLTKYALLDIPVDYFSVILGHEFFGHGSRYREFNIDGIHYSFMLPPPYGKGGGESSKNGALPVSYHQLLSIWSGGIEIHPGINRVLSLRWMSRNEMSYREASQYFWSFQIFITYIQDTKEDLFDGTTDNDIRAYTRIINAQAVYTEPDNIKMSVKDLKSKMMINAVNPFLFYSLYSMIKTYLWDGNQSNEVPMISFGDVKYLPSLRAGFTPFGIEYHLDNYIILKNITSLIDIRYGDKTFYNTWGGVGIYVQNIKRLTRFSFDVNLNIWKQPGLKFGNDKAELKGNGIGGAFSIRGYYDFPNTEIPVSAILELGYKSIGFQEGYSLDSSPILALGLALRY